MSFKTSIKDFIPPFVLRRVRPLKRNIKRFFEGRGEDWIVLTQGPLEGLEFFCSGLRREAIRLVASGKIDDYLFDYVKTAEPEGKVLFDVGAYVGYVTLGFAKLVGAEGKVLAFEPNSGNRAWLESQWNKNTSVQDRIRIVPVALSDRNGEEEFVYSDSVFDGRASGSFLESASTFAPREVYELEQGFKRCLVKTQTLDDFAEKEKIWPDIIKIDVEGAEASVIKGAARTIDSRKPLILVELHSIKNAWEVTAMLSEHGYRTSLLKQEADGRCFVAARSQERSQLVHGNIAASVS
jgi:FkbM family methyltransferase